MDVPGHPVAVDRARIEGTAIIIAADEDSLERLQQPGNGRVGHDRDALRREVGVVHENRHVQTDVRRGPVLVYVGLGCSVSLRRQLKSTCVIDDKSLWQKPLSLSERVTGP